MGFLGASQRVPKVLWQVRTGRAKANASLQDKEILHNHFRYILELLGKSCPYTNADPKHEQRMPMRAVQMGYKNGVNQVQIEAGELADRLWLYHCEEEENITSIRYGNVLRWPQVKVGWDALIDDAPDRRTIAQKNYVNNVRANFVDKRLQDLGATTAFAHTLVRRKAPAYIADPGEVLRVQRATLGSSVVPADSYKTGMAHPYSRTAAKDQPGQDEGCAQTVPSKEKRRI